MGAIIRSVDGFIPMVGEGVFLAETAVVAGRVRLGIGSTVWYGTVLRADAGEIEIGEDSAILDNASLRPSPRVPLIKVGNRVSVGQGSILQGCTVGDGALLGHGCVVLEGAEVGPGTIISSGSLLPVGAKISAGVLARGRPAQVVRPLTELELMSGQLAAQHHKEMAEKHR